MDIDCIEAAGVCVNLHVAGKPLLYRSTLQELVDKLDPLRFVRVHRSAVVNIESILHLEPISHGEFEVTRGALAREPHLPAAVGETARAVFVDKLEVRSQKLEVQRFWEVTRDF